MPDPSNAGKYCTEYGVLGTSTPRGLVLCSIRVWYLHGVLRTSAVLGRECCRTTRRRKSKVESRMHPFQGQDSNGPMLRCCPSNVAKIAVVEAMQFLAGLMRRFGGHMNVLDEGVTIFLYTFMHVQYNTVRCVW